MFKNLFSWSKRVKKLDPDKIPEHVAIIMDGNGRWAQKRGLPRTAGHQKGVQTLKEICYACGELGIKYLTVYAFSTENWYRPTSEVNFLMELFKKAMRNEIGELEENNVRVRILGRRQGVDPDILAEIDRVEERTCKNDGLILSICFNYGGRAEIVDAVKKILSKYHFHESIDEEYFKEFLYTHGLPDVELLIRTGGEQRLSNFLLYQSAYAELVFTNVFWPDFTKKDLVDAIYEFQNRERRFGRIGKV
ncbi:di-trans,poly-cis-decaprenylcistransferase [Anoxybacter fermentans]|uniref:Isoprenyl transferase n=1 Tax=Anoxybacter fermentans TaxID=1323375 RepID=A0A3Q9HP15_9FIRM|nr:isoprenyl transferase [Anoxybacter fermentans]AZR72376.1 di-trans,poly-cis-decaprenylcistransferase [Anoxybacter fermentans]